MSEALSHDTPLGLRVASEARVGVPLPRMSVPSEGGQHEHHGIFSHECSNMIFYHFTNREAAEAIIAEGFRDAEGFYGFARQHPVTGVWVSDRPLGPNETGKIYDEEDEAWVQLTVELPQAVIDAHEVVSDIDMGYREWLFPAALLNAHASMVIYDPWADEAD